MPAREVSIGLSYALMLYPGFDGWHWQIRATAPEEDSENWPSLLLAHSGPIGLESKAAIDSLNDAFMRVRGDLQGCRAFEICIDEPHPPWRSDYVVTAGIKAGAWFFMVVANIAQENGSDGATEIVPNVAADGGPFENLVEAFNVGVDVLGFCRSWHDGMGDTSGESFPPRLH